MCFSFWCEMCFDAYSDFDIIAVCSVYKFHYSTKLFRNSSKVRYFFLYHLKLTGISDLLCFFINR